MAQQMVLPEGGLASFLSSNMDEMDDSRLAFGRQNGINSMRETAERMALMGRGGDDVIIHAKTNERLIPQEVSDGNPELMSQVDIAIANAGADPSAYIVGSETNSVNPYTGQREFFLKKLIGGVKNILKAVAPIVIPMALNFFAPGMGTMMSGFIGGGITALAQGKNFKDSMKAGLISGAIGGISSGLRGVMGGGKGTMIQKFGEGFKQGAMPDFKKFPLLDGPAGDGKQYLGRDYKPLTEAPTPTENSILDKFYTPATEALPGMPLEEAVAAVQNAGLDPNVGAGLAEFNKLRAGTDAVKGSVNLIPTATAILGAGAAFGGLDPIAAPKLDDAYDKPSASEERLAANPERYKVGSAGDPTYITMADTLVQPNYNPYYEQYLRPQQAAAGGEMYPRRNGYIAGPGTETSDDIPAMLSDGEFVMTAQAVRGLGNGNRQQGVRKMYDMMRSFEGGAVA